MRWRRSRRAAGPDDPAGDMQTLSSEFLDQCRIESGFRLRGEQMSRIEVFVDAAFAFSVTLLVISFDRIPQSVDEFVVAAKGIPAFVASVAQLVWIWHAHSVWSRRFGLTDATTVLLSTMLLIVVLIYIYPMRVMLAGMFGWMTEGYLPFAMRLESLDQLSWMFVFLGSGFIALCIVFFLLYRYAIRRRNELRLNEFEIHESATFAMCWAGCAVIGATSIALALTLPDPWLPFSGFAYFLIGAWIPLCIGLRHRQQPKDRDAN